MLRDLTPIVTNTLDYFRKKGKLPNGLSRPLEPEAVQDSAEIVKSRFGSVELRDNKATDLDQRPFHLLEWEQNLPRLTSWSGNFQQGQIESNAPLPGQGQYCEITQTDASSIRVLEAFWNPQEATFLSYHLDRRKPGQGTLTAWQLGENSQTP